MSVFTTNPVRSDLAEEQAPDTTTPLTSRSWAVAGVVAAVAGIVSFVTSGMVDSVYRDDLRDRPDALVAALGEKVPVILTFHTAAMVAAVAMMVFAAGLHRRLAARVPGLLAPVLAVSGLVGTAVVLVIGSGLDTEYVFGFSRPGLVTPAEAATFNHWIGTVPWCWVLTGLAGLAVFSAARAGGVPRWLGRVGLVGGALTLVAGISPLQYMAGMIAPLWLLVLAVGFVAGDRAFLSGR